jgi:cobalt-zinc-cadmium efflux system membrane fusion protein
MTTQMNSTVSKRALALLVPFAALAACSSSRTGKPADSATVRPNAAATTAATFTLTPEQRQRINVTVVQPEPFRPMVEATGTVAFNGDRSTQVLSPVSGPVTRVLVNPGVTVSSGTPLAYVSSPDFAAGVATYRKAQTAYRNAKRIANRDSLLFKNDAIARGDLEQAQADVAGAEADLEAAIQQMRALGVEESQIQAVRNGGLAPIQAIIRAPISGTVVEKLISPGQLLAAGSTPAFTIADLSTMWVNASVFAPDLKDVTTGQNAEIVTDASPVPIPGRVDYVSALVDPASKAISVRIVAPNNNLVLRRDMFVRVRIKSAHEHHGLLVPSSAVLRDEQNLPFVYVASGNDFVRRRIELGSRVDDHYEVASGLKPGDQVAGDGALFLQFAESQ